AILAVSVFGYGLLHPREVQVEADGRNVVVETKMSSDAAVLSGAGVDLHPGDRVTTLDGAGREVLRVDRARDVTLQVDGATYAVRTHALTIDQLLSEADVAVNGRDSVLQNGVLVSMNAPVDPPHLFASTGAVADTVTGDEQIDIDVRGAVPCTIVENGNEVASTSSRPTVAQALREAG